jgi:hypothetical protein
MTEKPRDYSFEAMVEVTGADISQLTSDERGRINRALKELRVLIEDDYILADAIHEHAKAYKIVYPEIALTPQALTGQWSSIQEKAGAMTKPRLTQSPSAAVPPPGRRVCETCDGGRMVFTGTRDGNEEWAPCPDCNSGANVEFWRADGSRFRSPDSDQIRARMNS